MSTSMIPATNYTFGESHGELRVRRTFLDVNDVSEHEARPLRMCRSCGDLPATSKTLDLALAQISPLTQSVLKLKTVPGTGALSEASTLSVAGEAAASNQSGESDTGSMDGTMASYKGSHFSTAEGLQFGSARKQSAAARRRERRRRATQDSTREDALEHTLPEASTTSINCLGEEVEKPLGAKEECTLALTASTSSMPLACGLQPVAHSNGQDWQAPPRETPAIPDTSPSNVDLLLGKKVDTDRGSVDRVLQGLNKNIYALSIEGIIDVLHSVGKCVEGDRDCSANNNSVHDHRFVELVAQLRRLVDATPEGLTKSRMIARAVWGLGKVGAMGFDTVALLDHFVRHLQPEILESFTSQELSNSLWGLARLSASTNCRAQCEKLALRVMGVSNIRLQALTAQCLANSLWSIAKIGLRGVGVTQFVYGCIHEMCQPGRLTGFSSQGLANSLWAAAKLQLSGSEGIAFCRAAASEAGPERLASFASQELSMAVWALAKILCRSGKTMGGRPRQQSSTFRCPEAVGFALACAQEATNRLASLSPQGLSNIAWSLATLDLANEPLAKKFMLAAAAKAVPELHWFPPQAIANLSWALCRLGDVSRCEVSAEFSRAAAVQAQCRMQQFEWQDLAGIICALSRCGAGFFPEVQEFASCLVAMAAVESCEEIGSQALLNVALSAARLGVSAENMWPFVERINDFIKKGSLCLNGIDSRQWNEVKRHCGFADDAACKPQRGAALARTGCLQEAWKQEVLPREVLSSAKLVAQSRPVSNARHVDLGFSLVFVPLA